MLMEVGLVAAQGLLAGDGRPFEVRQDQKSRITKQRDFTPARLSARLLATPPFRAEIQWCVGEGIYLQSPARIHLRPILPLSFLLRSFLYGFISFSSLFKPTYVTRVICS